MTDDNEEHDWITADPEQLGRLCARALLYDREKLEAEVVALKKGIRSLLESRKKWKRKYHKEHAARRAAEARANQ